MNPEIPETLDFLRAPPGEPDPAVTVVREIHVQPVHRTEFERLMGVLIGEAMRQPGYLGASIVRPHSHGECYRFIYKFDRRSSLRAWHDSETRARLFAPVAELIDHNRFDEYPGLETWFDLPPAATPPKWKTTTLSWLAIYPAVVGLSYLLKALGFAAPLPIQALVLTLLVVPLVAYVLAPWLGRRFRRWLDSGTLPPRPSAPPAGP
ncbi:MAG: antibiotic biosynthesis monooxygenase [Phycisphaerales bacterium]|nr:antibiotic biosynthesis monooxygenase [Phycisphaerales bacterium]